MKSPSLTKTIGERYRRVCDETEARVPRWHDAVKDPPKKYGEYLVHNGKMMWVDEWLESLGVWNDVHDGEDPVLWWMPIPEPPHGDKTQKRGAK